MIRAGSAGRRSELEEQHEGDAPQARQVVHEDAASQSALLRNAVTAST